MQAKELAERALNVLTCQPQLHWAISPNSWVRHSLLYSTLRNFSQKCQIHVSAYEFSCQFFSFIRSKQVSPRTISGLAGSQLVVSPQQVTLTAQHDIRVIKMENTFAREPIFHQNKQTNKINAYNYAAQEVTRVS